MLIAGVDEVGRGPLAGPVVAAAVILSQDIPGVMDSKKLSAKKRKLLSEIIKSEAISYAYGRVEPQEIDVLNIHNATLLAMQRAIDGLSVKPDKIMIDGLYVPKVQPICEAIVKGDSLINSIAAASILAKVKRDDEMVEMDKIYPGYDFAKHKGYPTKAHKQALNAIGPSEIHRMSFAPCNLFKSDFM